MQVTIDDITRDKIVSSLQHHLAEDTRDMSEPIHLSDITRCLTKSTLSRMTAEYNQSDIEANAAQIDPTSASMMYIGVLAEKALDDLAPERPVDYLEGVTARADWNLDGDFIELKTTRVYVTQKDKKLTFPSKGFVQEWVRRMAGYCMIYGKYNWKLAMMLVVRGDLIVYDFQFTPEEIRHYYDNFFVPRRLILKSAIETNRIPEPFRYNDDWECRNCQFKMQCDFQAFGGTPVFSETDLGVSSPDPGYMDREDVDEENKWLLHKI